MTTEKITPEPTPAPARVLPAAPAAATPEAPPTQKAAQPTPAKSPVVKVATGKVATGKVAVKKAAVKKAIPRKAVAKAPPAKTAVPTKLEKAVKSKKTKLVRDSFTIPKAEYVVLDELKQRATKLTRPVKKSELLRAGIKILLALSDAAFLTALEQVPTIKTGRPTLNK